MPSAVIRGLRAPDHDAWQALFADYIAFYERNLPAAAYERTWRELLEGKRIHGRVAERDGELVGIVHFLVHAHTNADDVCYLQDLFTAPAARGQGVGRALISHVTDWAHERGLSRVYWHTQESNERARRLYDQVGEYRGFIVYQITP